MAGTASNRFATSALSRKNKASAIPEEILVHKHTGQMLIKTAEGDVVSYDSMARLKNHLDKVTLFAQNNGLRGDISSVEFDDKELPEVIEEGVNLLSGPLTLKANDPKRWLISLDVDTIELSESDTIGLEPTVEVKFNVEQGITTQVKGPVSSIAAKIIDMASYFAVGSDLSQHSIAITSIRILKNDQYDESAQIRHILHSVLTIIE